jgi:uroporphyrinogen III methyltransferase/synthase
MTGTGLGLRPPGDLPLSGRTVVVTRAAHQASPLSEKLLRLGARVLEVPTIALAPPADQGRALAAARGRLARGEYAWAVFTSANGVDRLFGRAPGACLPATTRVAAVGPATAAALRAYRVMADLVPAEAGAEGLAAAFPPPPPPPALRAVLLPQAAGARPELKALLGHQGWQVDAVDAYRTVPCPIEPALLAALSGAGAICFASSSAVNSLVDQAGAAPLPPLVACIGPGTAATARARGLVVNAEASEHTLDGLVAALVSALAGPPG